MFSISQRLFIYLSPPSSPLELIYLWHLNILSARLSSFHLFLSLTLSSFSPPIISPCQFMVRVRAIFSFPLVDTWFLCLLSKVYFSLPLSEFYFLFLLVYILHILHFKLPNPSSLYLLTFNFLFKISVFLFSFLHFSLCAGLIPPLSQGTLGLDFTILLAISHSFSSTLLFGLQTGIISNTTQPETIVHLAQTDNEWIYDPTLLIRPLGVTTKKNSPSLFNIQCLC